jgi:TRAP-type C4-dicarboxylate transport system permease large subunit
MLIGFCVAGLAGALDLGAGCRGTSGSGAAGFGLKARQLILACYLVLGCFLEGFAMLVLSLPVFFPVITQLGIDPIWFGVLVVLTLEMGLISPPVGINVFIVKSVARDVPLGTIFRGVMPFWIAMLVVLGLLVAFPQISLLLPNTMIN